MKVVFITPVVPFVDGGTSAHIYHLMLEREKDIQIDIYTFNNNHRTDEEIKRVEKELNVRIHLTMMPKWVRLLFAFHLHFIRILLKFPIYYYLKVSKEVVQEIQRMRPDGIWIYGEELASITKQFPEFRRVHTLPDSEAMYYYRMLQQRFVTSVSLDYWKNALMYRKYVRMEGHYENHPSVTYHLVGEADADFIRNNNPVIDARFIRHPHYEVSPQLKMENGKWIFKFHQPKIKVLIAGQYNLYMKQEADLLIEQINENANENENFLQEHYTFTFLGKGWEKHVEALRKVGYEVEHIKFAPNYQEELIKHDIQITPIAIGTGTKGKVLDALANGLLVIGTQYAMENIAVKNGESCIVYREPQEVIEVLRDIVNGNDNVNGNREKYERMAELGRKQVLTLHGRSVVSKQLFGLFTNNDKNAQ